MLKSTLENIRNKVLILTNGQRSEKYYFDLIKEYYKSPYEIHNKFLQGAPKYLAEYAIEVKNEFNKIFIVVDVDQFSKSIEEAFQIIKAYKNTIFMILSNISFEVWLVNHYKQLSSYKSVNELIDDINSFLANNGSSARYSKNNKSIIEKYFIQNLPIAFKNTKLLYQKLLRDYQITNAKKPNFCDLKSSSMMYKIVEELRLTPKNKSTK